MQERTGFGDTNALRATAADGGETCDVPHHTRTLPHTPGLRPCKVGSESEPEPEPEWIGEAVKET